MTFTNKFIIRERKREIARLEKRKGAVLARITDMQNAVDLIDNQIAEHKSEIAAMEAPQK